MDTDITSLSIEVLGCIEQLPPACVELEATVASMTLFGEAVSPNGSFTPACCLLGQPA